MMALVLGVLRGAGLKILLWVAAAGAVAAVLLGARQAGRNAERVEGMLRQLENVRTSHEIDRRVDRLPDGAAAQRLRERWSRD